MATLRAIIIASRAAMGANRCSIRSKPSMQLGTCLFLPHILPDSRRSTMKHPSLRSLALPLLISVLCLFSAGCGDDPVAPSAAPSLPDRSSIDFDVNRDGLYGEGRIEEMCFGETSFVKWYWEYVYKTHGNPELSKWPPDADNPGGCDTEKQKLIAGMSQCVSKRHSTLDPNVYDRSNDGKVAERLMSLLGSSPKTPQLLAFRFKKGIGEIGSHSLLVYNYEAFDDGTPKVKFSAYDPSKLFRGECEDENRKEDKAAILVWQRGGQFTEHDQEFCEADIFDYYPGDSGEIYGFRVIEVPSAEWCWDFVYRYFEYPPEIGDMSPSGVTAERRPAIGVTINYPYIQFNCDNCQNEQDIENHTNQYGATFLTELTLDGSFVAPITVSHSGPHTARVTFQPAAELSLGEHRVAASVSTVFPGRNSNECVGQFVDSWTFTIEEQQTIWVFNWGLSGSRSFTCHAGIPETVGQCSADRSLSLYLSVLSYPIAGVEIADASHLVAQATIEVGMSVIYDPSNLAETGAAPLATLPAGDTYRAFLTVDEYVPPSAPSYGRLSGRITGCLGRLIVPPGSDPPYTERIDIVSAELQNITIHWDEGASANALKGGDTDGQTDLKCRTGVDHFRLGVVDPLFSHDRHLRAVKDLLGGHIR